MSAILTIMEHQTFVEILLREGATDRGVGARDKLYAHDRALRAALDAVVEVKEPREVVPCRK